MEYWQGQMNWPIDIDWVCETCGEVSLTWGLQHGECRCNTCHTLYVMRDFDKSEHPVVTRPISEIKEASKPLLKAGWQKYHTPFDEWNEEQWTKLEKVRTS